jgi:2-oxoisovalerate dehydrogenase E1 component beta subunit
MTTMNMVSAINDALRTEMRRDERVLVLGEDIGKLGGVFRATDGLQKEFGAERVVDTPLSESGIVGAAIGMALYGLRPVAEIEFADFVYPAMDQVVTEAAKYRYRSGGQMGCPLVIRTPAGGGIRGGMYHSQSPESLFIHTAGLKVVYPSNAADARGLLLGAIRDPDPVIFFEPKRVYRAGKMEVPDGEEALPLGRAAVARAGNDLTAVSWGAMVPETLKAAEQAQAGGVSAEVIDLRTLWPVDIDTVVQSVTRTGRLLAVHEASRACGFGAELVSQVCERAIDSLEAPPRRVTGYDIPVPYTLEDEYLPLAHRIAPAMVETARY